MNKAKLRRIYTTEFYKGNRISFLLALLSTVLISVVNLGLSWLMQQMIDSASGLENTYSLTELVLLTVIIIVSIVSIKLLNYISKPRFIKKAMAQYKNTAFTKLTQKSIASFNNETTATYLSALTNDAITIETNYVANSFDILFNIVLMLGALAMMLWYSPLLTVVAVAFFLLPIGVSLIAGNRMKTIETRVSEKNSNFLASLKDSLVGFPVIKSFKAEKAMIDQFQKNNQTLENEKCNKRKISTVLGMLGSVAGVAAQFGTFLVGIYLASAGYGITPGVLIIFTDLTANIINPIRDLPDYLAQRKAAAELITKLAESLEANIRDEGEHIPVKLTDSIELKNVSFGYDDEHIVLHNINTAFLAGKSYAIVGTSGSGKSTLLSLLMASHSTYSGEICYDTHELHKISSEALYDIISMIQQNVFIFNDTIRNNITLFGSFASEDVQKAIELSGLTPLIEQHGDNYLCGENGNNLSGGEKQRISIARSLLRKSPVLLVDEATAALDRETAYRVSDAILNLHGLTRIVVTHSLEEALLRRYDEIIVLKDGCIVEKGTFNNLMANKSDFYALYTMAQ